VYNTEQLHQWSLSNVKWPVVFARVNPATKKQLDILVARKGTTKAAYIADLLDRALHQAIKSM
jgi:hypothetical protein